MIVVMALLLLPGCNTAQSGNATTPSGEYNSFLREFDSILARKPKYVWGGASSPERGLDCSGIIFLAARRAGKNVKRTTAERMHRGESGWAGKDVPLSKDLKSGTIIWWTLKEKRPHGHVGVIKRNPDVAAHMSSKRNMGVLDKLDGWVIDKLTGLKEIFGLR